MQALAQAGHLIIDTLFSAYIMVVLLRFLLQVVRADFYNPVSQFTVRATAPLLNPLRKIIPGFGGMDIAALVLIVALQVIKYLLLLLLQNGYLYPLMPLFMIATVNTLALVVKFYTWGIIIMAVLSWFAAAGYNPILDMLMQILEPLLAPFRRLLPAMGGLDLSPLLAILALQIFEILVLNPLTGYIYGMALRGTAG